MMEFLINHWRGCAVVFLPIIVIFTSSLILIKGLEAQILTRDEGPNWLVERGYFDSGVYFIYYKARSFNLCHQVINGWFFSKDIVSWEI